MMGGIVNTTRINPKKKAIIVSVISIFYNWVYNEFNGQKNYNVTNIVKQTEKSF